jgi:pyruvate/2-oxoglutarate dehydrogenase complex dihydrolipoamide dehydrogenase (E3) component
MNQGDPHVSTHKRIRLGRDRGGPTGVFGAATATAFGKTVALVDRYRELGETGANLGTIPSKTLRETALALSGFRTRRLMSPDVFMRREATVAEFLKYEQKVKAGLNGAKIRLRTPCNTRI